MIELPQIATVGWGSETRLVSGWDTVVVSNIFLPMGLRLCNKVQWRGGGVAVEKPFRSLPSLFTAA